MKIQVREYMKIMLMSILFIGIIANVNIVNAEEVDDENAIKVSTIDSEFDTKTQEMIYGSEKQLARVNKNTMRFIKKIAFGAHTSSREYGLYPSVTIAQAVLESGGGTSGLSISPYYNLFGIKGAYNGNTVSMRTMEDDGTGNLYQIYANFKVYPSWDESIRDHNELLRNGLNGYYTSAWRINARTPAQSARALQGRYATDTSYASKLINIINDYNLERFDGYLTERDLEWLNSDSLDPWELPIVEDYVPEKRQTWASGYLEAPLKYLKRISAANKVIVTDGLDGKAADLFYVKETLNLEDEAFGQSKIRFKRNPSIGDIAVYKTENGNNEVIEKYAVVERIFRDKILISEGVMGKDGLHSIYREIGNELLYRFEFINIGEEEAINE